MKEIAIYGKGGIGKSTLTSNISAALSLCGKRVLQIGCDPKHDSTRLLTRGRRINTVLDYIRETGPLDYDLSEVLVKGFNGIDCIEAGGPEPGVGCAGRGIITAFDFLEKFQIKKSYDIILYDVLGDVVCGGFAVPIRNKYSDEIFIVTSGEYMSIYAANNILRGIKNYETKNRVAGIIFNSRNLKNEKARIKAFSEAVGLPVFAEIPRDDAFEKAERENKTIVEQGENPIAGIFFDIARDVIGEHKLYPAYPLSDEELEECIMGAEGIRRDRAVCVVNPVSSRFAVSDFSERVCEKVSRDACGAAKKSDVCEEPHGSAGVSRNIPSTEKSYIYDAGALSKNVIREEPLHGCAFNGAVTMGIHLKDAVIVAHSPKSCAYLSYQTISSSGRRSLYERGCALPVSLFPNLTSTDMDESDIVFGGMDKLIKKVGEISRKPEKPKAIIVISSCPAGIIGDDIDKVKGLTDAEIPVITVKTDGNLAGDYLQGMLMCYTELAEQIIDKAVNSVDKVVNIVFEKVVSKNTETNFHSVESLLRELGISVNCRFLSNTSYDSLVNFKKASLNLLAYRDYTGKILEDFFEKNYGSRFFEHQFPVGFEETEKWLRGIGAFFGETEKAQKIIEKNKKEYEDCIAEIRPELEGKSLMIVTYNHNVDWILRAALDCGMKIAKIGIMNFSQDEGFRSELPEIEDICVVDKYDIKGIYEDIAVLRPDILLTNYESTDMEGEHFTDTIPMCPDVGFFSGLAVVKRWSGLMKNNSEGEWQNDGYLVKKYYS